MSLAPRQVEERLNTVLLAWERLAPAATLAGLTLTEFKDKVKPSQNTRITIKSLEGQLSAAQSARDDADHETNRVIALVVHAVRGSPEHGEDSALYAAMGYVRKSQRGSGLKRKVVAPPAAS